MIRRESGTAWEDFKHTLFVAFILVLVFFATEPVVDKFFRSAYIDLKSVSVPNHVVGQNPELEVHRSIKRDFIGSFSVNIRAAETDKVVCLTSWPTYFPYKKNASKGGDLLSGMTLRSWIGNTDQLDECLSRGAFGAGAYYLETCHRSSLLWFPIQRCKESNVFYKKDKIDG